MNKFSRPVFIVLTTILMLLITFISCDNKLNVSNTNAVRFSTEIGRKAMADSEWQTNDKVGIYMVAHDALTASATTGRANQAYTADTAFQTSGFSPVDASNPLKWDDLSTNPAPFFDFIAYYPYDENISDPTAIPIDINRSSSEQMTGTADFLWGRTDNVQNNTSTVHLKLDHMFSRLIVNISPSTTVDADAITGGVLSAMVEGTSTQGTFNLDTGALSVTSSVEGIIMKNLSHTLSQAEQDAGKRRFEAVLIPVVHSEVLLDALKLEFTLDSDTYTWAADSVADEDKHLIHFDKGKQHVYNMTLNTSDEEVAVAAIQIEIREWDESDGINAPAVKVGVKSVSAGQLHTMILKTDGTLWATGYNGFGQLCDGTTIDKTIPVQVMTDVKAVSAGTTHTMILKKDGTLWAIGENSNGQLGDGTTTDRTTPVPVKASIDPDDFMTGVAAVSAGNHHTMILKKDGTLWATGTNFSGELGDGTTTDRTTPVQVKASTAPNDFMTNVAAVSTGIDYTMILKKDGTLWATGFNLFGQLGVGDNNSIKTPVQVWNSINGSVLMTDVAAVSAGDAHSMILKKNGTLWATGDNYSGQLGLGAESTYRTSTPVQVMPNVAAVSVGNEHTMILKKDGTLWATGRNNYGQLGDGTTTEKTTPVQVKASTADNDFMTDVAAVSSGDYYTMILKKDGTLWATGFNSNGQLGLSDSGSGTNRNTPVQVIF
ncbi:fimbrillin family protein [Parasphaerochaeta coccoides]|uniref:Regulator of chromosome condensation RCC1 n=1 Tax=Parasphaerochaeta coccoides (strain ATCC BAA-1237 / DSM 17374 / SPN1) TaxID=760011 RepID=F4GLR7_PARC1|nr:fimbrillin family protein [Parasphaerochaeta coccoides]AEC02461.1 regulator of chromosome condensation RCC1 [Parasphaerochaeta coccoides DSM 17374]